MGHNKVNGLGGFCPMVFHIKPHTQTRWNSSLWKYTYQKYDADFLTPWWLSMLSGKGMTSLDDDN